MGNGPGKHSKPSTSAELCSSSSTSGATSAAPSQNVTLDPVIDGYFQRLADSPTSISMARFVELFEQDLAESLWRYFSTSPSPPKETDTISRQEFNEKFAPLSGSSADIYVKILQPVHHFIKVCSESAGAQAIRGDEVFITNLVEQMTNGAGNSGEEEILRNIMEWRRAKCEKFCQSVQNRVISKATGIPTNLQDYSSDILTPLQMYYLQSCLPATYFPNRDKLEEKHWTPLYTSLQHGISTNRFETLVFDYRGPTVSIFRLKDGRIVVIALDQEWRHSSVRFGGPNTSFFEISPKIRRIDGLSNAVYCNLKLRTAAYGLSFKEELKVDKDFSEVYDIEVWGCSGASTLQEQQKLKNWQKQQAEKHKKVPLPGNWDDNPDKTLLEMAGFQFSNERKNMEMEARQKEVISSRESTISQK